jgi:LysM repeat protein
MPDGNLVRYLAPAALVVAALAILFTWQSSVSSDTPPEPAGQDESAEPTAQDEEEGGGDSGGEEGGAPEAGDAPEGGDEPQAGDEAAEGEGETYTIQAGDSLSTIAARTGVDVETLLELNPDAEPQQLQAGEELELGP